MKMIKTTTEILRSKAIYYVSINDDIVLVSLSLMECKKYLTKEIAKRDMSKELIYKYYIGMDNIYIER